MCFLFFVTDLTCFLGKLITDKISIKGKWRCKPKIKCEKKVNYQTKKSNLIFVENLVLKGVGVVGSQKKNN